MCREEFLLPAKGVRGLRHNFILEGLVNAKINRTNQLQQQQLGGVATTSAERVQSREYDREHAVERRRQPRSSTEQADETRMLDDEYARILASVEESEIDEQYRVIQEMEIAADTPAEERWMDDELLAGVQLEYETAGGEIIETVEQRRMLRALEIAEQNVRRMQEREREFEEQRKRMVQCRKLLELGLQLGLNRREQADHRQRLTHQGSGSELRNVDSCKNSKSA